MYHSDKEWAGLEVCVEEGNARASCSRGTVFADVALTWETPVI